MNKILNWRLITFILLFFFQRFSVNAGSHLRQRGFVIYAPRQLRQTKKKSKNRMAIWLSLEWLISLFFIYFLICYFLSCFLSWISYTFEECNFLLITTPAKKSTASKDKSTTTLMLNCENGLSENKKRTTWASHLNDTFL